MGMVQVPVIVPYQSPYAARVAKGAALLDQVEPGWEWRVDPARVRVESWSNGVVELLYGVPYPTAYYWLFSKLDSKVIYSMADLGFTLYEIEDECEPFIRFAGLTVEWRRAITERREGSQRCWSS